MSQFFSLSRFGRLFSKHTTEHWGGYLLATGVLLGGIALVLGFVAYMNRGPMEHIVQIVIFTMGLLSSGAFFTSTVLADYSNKRQATAALMLPASHWEKYLVGWLYAVPIFLAIYVGCFYLVDFVVLQVDSHAGPDPGIVPLFSNDSNLYLALLGYLVVNAVFLWGGIFFEKQHFVRTAFAVLLVGAVVVLVNMQAVELLMGREVSGVVPFSGMSFHEGKSWYSVNLEQAQNSWFWMVPLGVMLLTWAAAYARVTEKQI